MRKKIKRKPAASRSGGRERGNRGGKALLDLCYSEDVAAAVDLNLVMNSPPENSSSCKAPARKPTFSEAELAALLALGKKGVRDLLEAQKKAINGSGS